MPGKAGRKPRLAATVREQILQDWVAGRNPEDPLPSEPELMRQYSVSRNTIRRVLAAMEQSNLVFRPPYGRATVSRYFDRSQWKEFEGRTIVLSCPSVYSAFTDSFCSSVAASFLRELYATGIDIRITSRNWPLQIRAVSPAEQFASADVIGLALVGRQQAGVVEALLSLKRPGVAIDFDATLAGFDSYCFDNQGAGELLARRLVKLGHRRVLALSESPEKPASRQDEAWSERRQGFLSAWARQEMPPPVELYLEDRGIFEDILAQIRQELALPAERRPTALLLPMDDHQRMTELAQEAGLRVPQDLTLMGYGDLNPGSALTGMRFDGKDLARPAASGLLKQLRSPGQGKGPGRLVRVKGLYVAGKTHAQAGGE